MRPRFRNGRHSGMSESTSPEPPTFFANVATMQLGTDEAYIELRRVMQTHSDVWRATKGSGEVPKLSDEAIYAAPVVARIVLTFRAARGLRENLNTLMPTFEERRKAGE